MSISRVNSGDVYMGDGYSSDSTSEDDPAVNWIEFVAAAALAQELQDFAIEYRRAVSATPSQEQTQQGTQTQEPKPS